MYTTVFIEKPKVNFKKGKENKTKQNNNKNAWSITDLMKYVMTLVYMYNELE